MAGGATMNHDARPQSRARPGGGNPGFPVDFETAKRPRGLHESVMDRSNVPASPGDLAEQAAGATEEDAFRVFAERQAEEKNVRRHAHLLGVAEDFATDMVQDTLSRLWSRRAEVTPSHWPAWFRKTMLREAFHRSRAQRRAKRHEAAVAFELSIPPWNPTPEVELHQRECARELSHLLASLRPERREVVELHLLQELPMKEVAARLGIPENTAKNRWRLAQRDMNAAYRRDRARERFAAFVAALWGILLVSWERLCRGAARRPASILACAALVVVVALHDDSTRALSAEEDDSPPALERFEYAFSLQKSAMAFAERERAGHPGQTAAPAEEAPRALLAQAAAALLEGKPEVARSCLSHYRAAYGASAHGRFATQYEALAAQLASH